MGGEAAYTPGFDNNTGFPTKNETSDTTVRSLLRLISYNYCIIILLILFLSNIIQ